MARASCRAWLAWPQCPHGTGNIWHGHHVTIGHSWHGHNVSVGTGQGHDVSMGHRARLAQPQCPRRHRVLLAWPWCPHGAQLVGPRWPCQGTSWTSSPWVGWPRHRGSGIRVGDSPLPLGLCVAAATGAGCADGGGVAQGVPQTEWAPPGTRGLRAWKGLCQTQVGVQVRSLSLAQGHQQCRCLPTAPVQLCSACQQHCSYRSCTMAQPWAGGGCPGHAGHTAAGRCTGEVSGCRRQVTIFQHTVPSPKQMQIQVSQNGSSAKNNWEEMLKKSKYFF